MTTTRERILDAATQLLITGGHDTFSMADVRTLADVSNGSLFHAFPTRAALVATAYVRGMAAYQHVAVEAIRAPGPAVDVVGRLVAVHLAWVEDHRDLARFLFSTLPADVLEEVAAPLSGTNDQFHAALDDLHERLRDENDLGPLDRETAHAIVIGPAQEYCRRWIRGFADRPPTAVTTYFQAAARRALESTADHPAT